MRHYNQLGLSIVVAAGLSTLGALQSTADTIYTYTGAHFTHVISPYTTNDFVSGSFDLATPLGNNFPLATISPMSFSFSDGVQTIASPSQPSAIIFRFQVQTGSSGVPVAWVIVVSNFSPTNNQVGTCASATFPLPQQCNPPTIDFGFTSLVPITTNPSGSSPFDSPGSWTITTTPVPGPTIGSGLTGFILAGGGLLVWWRVRRKTGKSHSVALAAA
jgi:hypothetical protein